MNILTVENETFNLDYVPEDSKGIYFGVLDCTDTKNIDYQFLPLVFLESFYAPSLVLKIGDYKIEMPLDWSILVCDEHYTEIETMPLTSLNDRGFHTPVFNPLKHMVPIPMEVEIEYVYAEVKWFFPKLKNGNALVIPLENSHEPLSALFVKEANKIPTPLDPAELF